MRDMTLIPMVDLYAQYMSIKSEIDTAIAEVISNSAFVRGLHVEKFEQLFSEIIGIDNCVSCANGTDALYIAMISLGIKPGDEVIVPSMSWIATSETVTQAGGRVVFCDIDPSTFTMDPQSLVEKITPRTVGVIPVHLYGQAAQMDRILKIAQQYKLWVIEDCAQAHLAKYQGRNVGTFGDVATFSFYPGKNLGAMGDAGAILTKDLMLAKKMAMYARHGGLNKGDHQIEGINSRMDGIQAAILNAKIPHLDKWTRSRQRIAFTYINKLSHINTITLPTIRDGSEHVWHLFVIKHAKRDLLSRHLNEHGISTSINYPLSLPFLPAYSRYNHVPHDFPNSFRCQNEILSLPIYPEMTDQSINKILNAIIEFN